MAKRIFEDGLDLSGGFSTRAGSVSNKKSFEDKPPPPPPPKVNQDLRRMEIQVIASNGDQPAPNNRYPDAVQTRYKAAMQVEAARKREAVPGHMRAKEGTDIEKYGRHLPRYTDPKRAAQSLQTADNYDPVQTLFRYDSEALNLEAEKKFYANPKNKGKKFIPEHDPTAPVYEGMPDRKGVKGLGRAYSQERGNLKREYLFDQRDHEQEFGSKIQEVLDKGLSVAVRRYFAIPNPVDREAQVEIENWQPKTKEKAVVTYDPEKINARSIRISKTVGGGQQIFGNPKFFKFLKPDKPEPS